MLKPSFIWLLHQPASATWCKRELAEKRPDLRFAFSRPGLTTFKLDEAHVDAPVPSSFARAHGYSLGRAADAAGVLAWAEALPEPPLRLHVFERDPDKPADERDRNVAGSRATALEQELRAAAPHRFLPGNEARAGEWVLDVITAPAEHAPEELFVGWHKHDRTRGRFPGGVGHAWVPPSAPSRAWAKIEEAIAWSGLLPRAGEVAVEIGASPGGASYALLERGLTVHGVDPGEMAPIVFGFEDRFVHHALPAAEVQRKDLPRTFQWLASDVNLAPMIALKYVERFVALAHGGLRGAFITLKLNDDGVFAALPKLAHRIERLGAREVRYVQLPSHRSEIAAILAW
ncbi:MAG: SAM-dependent methyltransferase [Deltaproteobacteria bacterium]|nr:SAM-dependent methyltransferase [Deltaproteobacteria bacterium]